MSQEAIAIAEVRALADRQHLIPKKDVSLMKTWLNYYSSSTEYSC